MKFDMHIHSTNSDGKCSVEELICLCEKRNIKTISITDHDCVDAYNNEQLKTFKGIVIKGAELSTEWERSIHILGYNIDVSNEKILELCDRIKQYRMKEFLIVIKKLKSKGIPISMFDFRKKNKMNIDTLAQYLYENGYGDSIIEIKKKYLSKYSDIYVPKKGNNINDVIDAIHSSKGKAILAHPWKYSRDLKQLEQMILSLKAIGIDGVEVFSNDKYLNKELIRICEDNNLIYTAGSDFHGETDIDIGIEDEKIYNCIKCDLITK